MRLGVKFSKISSFERILKSASEKSPDLRASFSGGVLRAVGILGGFSFFTKSTIFSI